MRFTEVVCYRSDEYDIWLGRHPKGSLLLEGFLKVGSNLKHLVEQVEDTRLSTAVKLVRRYGNFIERPYLLGQPCDGSIVAPVTALYLDFCSRHGLDAQVLHNEAYPGEGTLEPGAINTFAHWQGVRILHTWTAACYAGLLKLLTEVNQSTLRNTL